MQVSPVDGHPFGRYGLKNNAKTILWTVSLWSSTPDPSQGQPVACLELHYHLGLYDYRALLQRYSETRKLPAALEPAPPETSLHIRPLPLPPTSRTLLVRWDCNQVCAGIQGCVY